MKRTILFLLIVVLLSCPPIYAGECELVFRETSNNGDFKITVSLPEQEGDILVTPHTRGVRAFALAWDEYKGVDLRDYDVLAYTPKVATLPIQRLFFPVGTGKEEYRIAKDGTTTLDGEIYGVRIAPDEKIRELKPSDTVRYIEIGKRLLSIEEAITLSELYPNMKYINFAAWQRSRIGGFLVSNLPVEFVGWGHMEHVRFSSWRRISPDTYLEPIYDGHSDPSFSDCMGFLLKAIDIAPSLKFLDLPGGRTFRLKSETSKVLPSLEGILFRSPYMPQESFDRYLRSVKDLRILYLPRNPNGLTLPESVLSSKRMEHFSGTHKGIRDKIVPGYKSPVSWKLVSYRGGVTGLRLLSDKSKLQWLEITSSFNMHNPQWIAGWFPRLCYLKTPELAGMNYPTGFPETLRYLVSTNRAYGDANFAKAAAKLEELSCDSLRMDENSKLSTSAIKYLRLESAVQGELGTFEIALQLQPPEGFEVVEIRDSMYNIEDEEFGKLLVLLKKLKAKHIYIPFLLTTPETRKQLAQIKNLHIITYDKRTTYNGFSRFYWPRYWDAFGDIDWILRNVRSVEEWNVPPKGKLPGDR